MVSENKKLPSQAGEEARYRACLGGGKKKARTSVVYATQSTLCTYSFYLLKHVVDNFPGQLESLDIWGLKDQQV